MNAMHYYPEELKCKVKDVKPEELVEDMLDVASEVFNGEHYVSDSARIALQIYKDEILRRLNK
jgi:hypothetical protein